jgi:hypothetical protein
MSWSPAPSCRPMSWSPAPSCRQMSWSPAPSCRPMSWSPAPSCRQMSWSPAQSCHPMSWSPAPSCPQTSLAPSCRRISPSLAPSCPQTSPAPSCRRISPSLAPSCPQTSPAPTRAQSCLLSCLPTIPRRQQTSPRRPPSSLPLQPLSPPHLSRVRGWGAACRPPHLAPPLCSLGPRLLSPQPAPPQHHPFLLPHVILQSRGTAWAAAAVSST